jgi:Fe-S cluster biogenesis protein NfuA
MADAGTRERIQKIEELIQHLDETGDAESRELISQLLQALMDLHSACLGRIVTVLSDYGNPGREILSTLGDDEMVSGLLLLYGLHPIPLAERIKSALHSLQPLLDSAKASVEIVSVDPEIVKLRIETNSNGGCHSNSTQLKEAIENAIVSVAPDVANLVIDEHALETPPVLVTLQGLTKSQQDTNAESTAAV